MLSLSAPEVESQGPGDGGGMSVKKSRSGGRLAGERHPGRTTDCSGTPQTWVPASLSTSSSVPLRRCCLLRACRRQKHNRARQWDRQERHGKAALVIGRRPRCGNAGPDFPCLRVLHVISKVIHWCVTGVHGAPSRLFERDSLAGWHGKHSHLRPMSLPRNPMKCALRSGVRRPSGETTQGQLSQRC